MGAILQYARGDDVAKNRNSNPGIRRLACLEIKGGNERVDYSV